MRVAPVHRSERVIQGLQCLLFQVDKTQVVVHEADDPDAFLDLFDAKFLTGERVRVLMRLRCMQMRPQAVTRTSRPLRGNSGADSRFAADHVLEGPQGKPD